MPRHRRAGSRFGHLSLALQAALQNEAVSLSSSADPETRIRATNDFYAQLDFELEQIASIRLDAIRELREAGWSYGRIAEATGLSKERVAQLCRVAGVAGVAGGQS